MGKTTRIDTVESFWILKMFECFSVNILFGGTFFQWIHLVLAGGDLKAEILGQNRPVSGTQDLNFSNSKSKENQKLWIRVEAENFFGLKFKDSKFERKPEETIKSLAATCFSNS